MTIKALEELKKISKTLELQEGKSKAFLDMIASNRKIPIDLQHFTKILNLKVDEKDLGDLSGRIKKTSEGYIIEINKDDPEVRKRFTIAHEIGHYMLHFNEIGNSITDDAMYRGRLSSEKETQANKFAAKLLMPWDGIIFFIKEYKKEHNNKTPLHSIWLNCLMFPL